MFKPIRLVARLTDSIPMYNWLACCATGSNCIMMMKTMHRQCYPVSLSLKTSPPLPVGMRINDCTGAYHAFYPVVQRVIQLCNEPFNNYASGQWLGIYVDNLGKLIQICRKDRALELISNSLCIPSWTVNVQGFIGRVGWGEWAESILVPEEYQQLVKFSPQINPLPHLTLLLPPLNNNFCGSKFRTSALTKPHPMSDN